MNRWRGALLAVTCAIAVAGFACGGAATSAPGSVDRIEAQANQIQSSPTQVGSAPSKPAQKETPTAVSPVTDRVARLLDSFPVWIGNGDAIAVSKSLTAEVFFAPYPPAPDGVMDILLLDPANGSPITDARVELSGEMQYMDHGVLRSVGAEGSGQSASEGHYLVPVSLIMFGEWVMTVKVSRDDWREQFELLVVVLP